MYRQLPPLTALRAFEAGARHLNFTRAADDLAVTQTAVSHQVKTLEAWVGKPLFVRSTRRLELTEAGRMLYPPVAEALDRISDAAVRVRDLADRRTLTLTVTPTFGSRWLAQRLGRFWRAHPEIDLRLHHSVARADLTRGEIDAGVRWGRGEWAGLETERLLHAGSTPMCSPSLLTGDPRLAVPADLERQVLLHEADYQEWTEWLAAAGVSTVNARRGPTIDNPTTLIRAAIDGHGVMMGVPAVMREEIARGDLVAPFETVLDETFAYYLVYRPGALERAHLRAFRDFLLEEIESDARATAEGLSPDTP